MKKLSSFALCLFFSAWISCTNAQWLQTNGPGGGFIYSLGISGSNIFAGTDERGIFLSTNNGSSWVAVDSGLTNERVTALTFSGTNIFAATYGRGVFLSVNNGNSWAAVNTGLTNIYI